MFDNFSLLAIGRDLLPFAKISLDTFGIKVSMHESGAKSVDLVAGDLIGTYFDLSKSNDELIERKLFGDIESMNRIKFDKGNLNKCYQDIWSNQARQNIANEENNAMKKENRMEIGLKMFAEGNMNIEIALNHFKVFLATPVYLRLVDFISMDDSVRPKQPEIGILKWSN